MTEDEKEEVARKAIYDAIQNYIDLYEDTRTLQDWVIGYSSVNFADVEENITNYGYIARTRQPLHNSLGIVHILRAQFSRGLNAVGEER